MCARGISGHLMPSYMKYWFSVAVKTFRMISSLKTVRRAVFEMSRRRTSTSWSDSGSEEEGSSPQPKSHCSVSNRDYEVRLLL